MISQQHIAIAVAVAVAAAVAIAVAVAVAAAVAIAVAIALIINSSYIRLKFNVHVVHFQNQPKTYRTIDDRYNQVTN